jgi:excinuclease ABC subunit A
MIYVLDEPTTGLHLDDVQKLLSVLDRLLARGDTVVVVEHHLDVIAAADHVIELGPEAGSDGGRIVGAGTPELIAGLPQSHTGRFLRERLGVAAPARPAARRRTASTEVP